MYIGEHIQVIYNVLAATSSITDRYRLFLGAGVDLDTVSELSLEDPGDEIRGNLFIMMTLGKNYIRQVPAIALSFQEGKKADPVLSYSNCPYMYRPANERFSELAKMLKPLFLCSEKDRGVMLERLGIDLRKTNLSGSPGAVGCRVANHIVYYTPGLEEEIYQKLAQMYP